MIELDVVTGPFFKGGAQPSGASTQVLLLLSQLVIDGQANKTVIPLPWETQPGRVWVSDPDGCSERPELRNDVRGNTGAYQSHAML